jgi:hypothetical protein
MIFTVCLIIFTTANFIADCYACKDPRNAYDLSYYYDMSDMAVAAIQATYAGFLMPVSDGSSQVPSFCPCNPPVIPPNPDPKPNPNPNPGPYIGQKCGVVGNPKQCCPIGVCYPDNPYDPNNGNGTCQSFPSFCAV